MQKQDDGLEYQDPDRAIPLDYDFDSDYKEDVDTKEVPLPARGNQEEQNKEGSK